MTAIRCAGRILYAKDCVMSFAYFLYSAYGGKRMREILKGTALLAFMAIILVVAPPFQCNPLVSIASAAEKPVTLDKEEVVAESAEEDTRLLSPGAVSVIRPEEMKGEQKNLPELLKRIPGLHIIETRGRGSYTVASIRGSTSAQVSVYVDGVLMNLASESSVDLSTIPIDNVDRIEVYRGYVPVKFAGASMGGVINIITKKPDKTSGKISVGVGSYGRYEGTLSTQMPLGDGFLLFGANYETSDGDFEYWNDAGTQYTSKDDYKATRHNNGYTNQDYLLKWNNNDWQLRASWKRNDRELPRGASGADDPRVPITLLSGNLNTEQSSFSVGRRFKSGNMDWGIRLDYLHQFKEYDNPFAAGAVGGGGEYHNEYRTNRFGVVLDAAMPLGENHMLEFYGDYSNEKLDIEGDILTAFTDWDNPIEGFRREAWNLQLQDTINLSKDNSFWITPIVRYNTMDDESEFSWGIALAKQLNSEWLLKMTGGTYNRAPNLYEQYGDGATIRPNPELTWEKGTQIDFSAEYKGKIKTADISAAATLFWRDSDNLIEFEMMTPRYGRYVNVGKAEVYGLEFEGVVKMDLWKFFLSATYMKTENKSESFRNGSELPNRPEFEGLFRVDREIRRDRLSAFAELYYCGRNYFDTAENVEMDSFFTAGLGITYKFDDAVSLTVGVDDLFDDTKDIMLRATSAGPTRMLWFPQQGRTFYATLRWIF